MLVNHYHLNLIMGRDVELLYWKQNYKEECFPNGNTLPTNCEESSLALAGVAHVCPKGSDI